MDDHGGGGGLPKQMYVHYVSTVIKSAFADISDYFHI